MTMRKVGSVLCLLVAVASVIFALFAKNMGGWFMGLALFRTIQSGGFIGFIGNIFGVLLTLVGFGYTGLCGLKDNDKNALVSSAGMLALCVVSALFAIFSPAVAFSFGDLIIMVPPALILISLFK